MGVEMGIANRGITGGYFQKLFTPKCRLSDLNSYDHWFVCCFAICLDSLYEKMCQDDESNPRPSALKLWSAITLRSPLSVVSDSIGHENEVDISISSEDKTSATGSNVAPRSMGSLFSPMEKTKKAQKKVDPSILKELYRGQNHLCSSLGSKKCCGLQCWLGRQGRYVSMWKDFWAIIKVRNWGC